MSKKILFIQTDLAGGTQWGQKHIGEFIREVCMPSVKNYCNKFGYDYKLIRESSYLNENKPDFLLSHVKHYAIEKYYHLINEDYDQVVYLDTDIYVSDTAECLPTCNGFMCVEEPRGPSRSLFQKVNNLSNSYPYYNAGFFMVDKINQINITNYMMNRIKNRIPAKGKNTDNVMLNEYLLEMQEFIDLRILEDKWNYMPFVSDPENKNNFNFFHFVGMSGKMLIQFMIDQSISINDFIKFTTFQIFEDSLRCLYQNGQNKRSLTIQYKN